LRARLFREVRTPVLEQIKGGGALGVVADDEVSLAVRGDVLADRAGRGLELTSIEICGCCADLFVFGRVGGLRDSLRLNVTGGTGPVKWLIFPCPAGRIGIRIEAEDQAMDSFIHLNLRSDSEKAAGDNSPKPEYREPEAPPVVGSKRLNKILKKAAHRASAEYGKSKGGGIFSK